MKKVEDGRKSLRTIGGAYILIIIKQGDGREIYILEPALTWSSITLYHPCSEVDIALRAARSQDASKWRPSYYHE